MKTLIAMTLALLFYSEVFSQTVEVNIDEQAIERQVERGIQQLDRLISKVNLNVNIKSSQTDQVNLDGPERSKTFSKSFPAGNGDKLILSNQYGSMQIKTWEKREVKVDVSIKAYGNSENDAQKLLDEVNIESGKQGDQIVFKTKMNQSNGNWGSGSRNGRRWRREVKVDYVVYMPVSNDLTLSQNYGNVSMEDLSGALYAKVQYGNFSAAELRNSNNYISVQYGKTDIQQMNKAVIKHQYGSGLTIGTVGSIDLDAQYAAVTINTVKGKASIKQQYGAGLTIGTTDQLDLDIQYANANVNTVKGNAKINQQYSNLNVGNVGSLDLDAQYTSAKIGSLRGNANIDMQYNQITIAEVGSQCRVLNIDGEYLSISIGFTNGFNADFDVNTSYASFRYGDNVSARLLGDKNSNTKSYTGKIGNGGGATVKVKSDYGSVLFK